MNYGIINLNKPAGPTSRDCVNQVAKRFSNEKVAHAGTLDPLAQGVLVILIGPAVRLMDEIHELDKEYLARFRLGCTSPSGDMETALEEVPIPEGLEEAQLLDAAMRFQGEIEQTPPVFSAVRVDGKRAHHAARRGASVQMPSRRVSIYELELMDCHLPEVLFRIRCSTGTYIRTLGSDIARALGTDAVMTELTRVRVGPFTLESAIPLEALPTPVPPEMIFSPASTAMQHWTQWVVDDSVMRRILDGQRLASQEVIESPAGRIAVLDSKQVLRAILKQFPDGSWRCAKGIAHWDILPRA
ncbi:MAG: tRNA pseudouridine(55) synthase TruB [Pirellula sp.]|nr:tRNA pseudouridine(55) synthase TruB [Pirellula sp.]